MTCVLRLPTAATGRTPETVDEAFQSLHWNDAINQHMAARLPLGGTISLTCAHPRHFFDGTDGYTLLRAMRLTATRLGAPDRISVVRTPTSVLSRRPGVDELRAPSPAGSLRDLVKSGKRVH